MHDEVARILALARDYPGLAIDAARARQIAAEVADLQQACAAAMLRFAPTQPARFDAMFARALRDNPAA